MTTDAASRSEGRIFPRAVSSDSLVSSVSRGSSLNPSRISVMPYLRSRNTIDDYNSQNKTPLLTMTLSSTSYLDSQVYDNVSRLPVYTIATDASSTVITRSDSWEGPTRAADIKWPKLPSVRAKGKDSEGVLVQMKDSSWKFATSLLRPGTLASSTHKFNIPGYSKSLKWKQVGTSFHCTTSSVRGPIAVLDPAAGSVPARIAVYETLHDKYDDTMDAHRGVSLLLLDYLLVTSLLLVTDTQEASKSDGDVSRISPMTTPPAAPSLAASPSQWRKIIFGEPLFPRRASNPAVIPPPLRPQLTSQSSTQVNTVYSVLPQIRGSSIDISASMLSLESDTQSDLEDTASSTRLPSPSAEPVTTSVMQPSAPGHAYLDPLFYAHDAPPVPPIPSQYVSQNVSRVSAASTASSSTSQRRVRILPQPPQSVQPRSRSTPPPESPPPRQSQESSSSESRSSQRPTRPVVRTSSIGPTRRLPVPPTPTTPGASTESSLQTPTSALHPSLREKRLSIHGRRSLPPTPMSAPLSGGFLDSDRFSSRRKTSDAHDALLEWVGGSSRNSVLDLPPPAYNTIVSSGSPVTAHESPPFVSPQSAGI